MDINQNTILERRHDEDFFESYPNVFEKFSQFRNSFKSESINNSFDEESGSGLCTFQVFFFDDRNVLNSAFICSAQYEQTPETGLKFNDFIADELFRGCLS